MTLLQRVQDIQTNVRSQAGADAHAFHGGALGVEDLRHDVQSHIALEKLAAIMIENPERARNELKMACRHVMTNPRWDIHTTLAKENLINELIDVVFGLGPIESLIYDEGISEIMVNGAKNIFFERAGKIERSPLVFESDEQVRVLIDRIIGPLGRRIDESSPMVNARLPQGHRVNAVIPPLSPDGPVLTIRAFTRHVMTLDEMCEKGSLDAGIKTFLSWIVRMRKNIAVSGGTGSGKTTMLNALSCLIPHDERIITIEDSLELKFTEHPHVVRLEARPRNAEGTGEVTIRDLVVNALRMRPDRIIVGECRAGEAMDMLQAMNTGHDGSLTTLHANSPQDAIDRMVTMARFAVDLPLDAIEAQIGNAFNFVVQVARTPTGKRLLTHLAAFSFDREKRRCQVALLYEREPDADQGIWYTIPPCVEDFVHHKRLTQKEVDAWRSGILLQE